jgi:hypothetical protein
MAFVGELIVEQNSNVLETVLDCSFDSYHLSPLIFSATVLVCKNDKFSHSYTWSQIFKWPFLMVSLKGNRGAVVIHQRKEVKHTTKPSGKTTTRRAVEGQ